MKVTVCFGSTKVVVPCGDGEFLVSELIEKAITRYRKACGKSADYWVVVHSLRSHGDGGILDHDDQLRDVTDDREQIIALYEEQDGPPITHNGGDGTSASSVGTSSPDIFHSIEYNNNNKEYSQFHRHGHKNDVIITANDLQTGSNLIVRRGSEPSLVKFQDNSQHVPHTTDLLPSKGNKRWSAIAAIEENKGPDHEESRISGASDTPPPTLQRVGGNGQERDSNDADDSFSAFARHSSRRSLANNAAMIKWLEAQENVQEQQSRKEPLGSSSTTEGVEEGVRSPTTIGTMMTLVNTPGPLGIHVVPDYDENGRDMGLIIQSIEPGGRIYRDGRLHVNDSIVEISGTSLMDISFNKAQEIFRKALQMDEVRLRIIKNQTIRQPPPLLSPSDRKVTPQLIGETSHREKKIAPVVPQKQNSGSPPGPAGMSSALSHSGSSASSLSKAPTTPSISPPLSPPDSPSKKTPPAVPARNPTTVLSTQPTISQPTNTRKIGKKIHIQLTKGGQGLGFSVTTRDNLSGGNAPIYIKNILPKGAAIQDGRLRSGDRLLEVNGIEMTGKSQTDAVNILRNTKMGSVVNIVVSRQVTESDDLPVTVRQPQTDYASDASSNEIVATEKVTEDVALLNKRNKEVIVLNIPVHESGSAGLGVSVKGKTTTLHTGETQDLGIFIKTIISGGAASQDGHLVVNDQMITVNGETMLGKTNMQAMETLRNAMQAEGPTLGCIHLVVARRKAAPAPSRSSSREVKISHSEAFMDETQLNSLLDMVNGTTPSQPGSVRNSICGSMENVSTNTLTRGGSVVTGRKDMPPPPPPQFANGPVGKLRNPHLDKLSGPSLRNTSYQMATHESYLNDTDNDSVLGPPPVPPKAFSQERKRSGDSTSSVSSADTDSVQLRQNNVPKTRPASTLGFLPMQQTDPSFGVLSSSKSSEDLVDSGSPNQTEWLPSYDDVEENVDADKTLTEGGFSREGFGRQSMSEKRKGHNDPKVSDFYQKMKATREDKGGSMQYLSATWDPRKSAFKKVQGNGADGAAAMKRVGSAESLLGYSNHRHSAMHESKPISRSQYDLRQMSDEDEDDEFSDNFTDEEDAREHLITYPPPPPYQHYLNQRMISYKSQPSLNQLAALAEMGPMLGMKKSSSLESLQTAVHEATMDEGSQDSTSWKKNVIARGRGCNESFRAAVDRSYDETGAESMETVDEEGSESGSQFPQSRGSSFSGNDPDGKKTAKKAKKEKEKKGLFQGIFKFGKSKKSGEEKTHKSSMTDLSKTQKQQPQQQQPQQQQQQQQKQPATTVTDHTIAPHDDRERIQEHYRQLQEKQRQIDFEKEQLRREAQRQGVTPPQTYPSQPPAPPSTGPPTVAPPRPPQSRSEKITNLRHEHQRRHQERQGQYPLDAQQEAAERRLRDLETKSQLENTKRVLDTSAYLNYPPRQHLDETPRQPLDEYNRPGSRTGLQEPGHYSHYQNLAEIQADIRRRDYYQQQYQHYREPPRHYDPYRAAPDPRLDPRVGPPAHGYPNAHPDPRWSGVLPAGTPASSHPHPYHASAVYSRGGYFPTPGSGGSVTGRPMSPPRGTDPRREFKTPATVTPQVLPGNHQEPNFSHGRQYSDYDDPRSAYSSHGNLEAGYASLPRRRDHRKQNGMMSGSAQV